MYCNNCGKEIMAADKFCPYCGNLINKKITFDVNMTPASIKKSLINSRESRVFICTRLL